MTKLQELQAKLESVKAEAQTAIDAMDAETAKAKMAEAKEIKDMISMQETLDAEAKAEMSVKAPAIVEKKEKSAVEKFAHAIRTGFKNTVTEMNEGTGADGGYAVPEDIKTQINLYKEESFSLLPYVDVEKVTTMSGARTYKTKATLTGFSKVNEGAAISAMNGPQFERVSYTIEKYAGVLPITNELLADSDASLVRTVLKWIADEGNVTENGLICTAIATNTQTDLEDLDGIKEAANVTLGQAYAGSCAIFTNDDGLQYLDTLKDGNSRYLLQPNPADPAEMRLQIGARTLPIVVIPNSTLATSSSKVPFIIGDLKEGIKVFDRQLITIDSSKEATVGDFNAYANDMTLYRAIERLDVVVKDSGAFVNGYITVS